MLSPRASATRGGRNPDAHVIAHETVRKLARRGSKRRETKTTKRLITHATEDLRLRDEKGLERLRAYARPLRQAMLTRHVGHL